VKGFPYSAIHARARELITENYTQLYTLELSWKTAMARNGARRALTIATNA
jgi:hypothetical protein